MNIRLLALFIGAIISFETPVFSQDRLGLPRVINYSKSDYKGAVQNWDIENDETGRMYFGNHYGLLEYDGFNWTFVLQPENRTMIQSLCKDNNGKLYIGASNDFGYMVRNSMGQVKFESLHHLLSDKNRDFAEVWNILNLSNKIAFVAKYLIAFYDGETIQEVAFQKEITFSGMFDHQLVIKLQDEELMIIDEEGQQEYLPGTKELAGLNIKSILPLEEKWLIASERNGLYLYDGNKVERWETPVERQLKSTRINTVVRLNEGSLAYGTMTDGLFISDAEGNISLHLNSKLGLQNNGVVAVYEDDRNNLWLTLNNGISYVELGSSFYYWDKRSGLEASVYGIRSFDNNLYAATNQGLFVLKKASKMFEMLPRIKEHIWKLKVFDDWLFIGAHTGNYFLHKGSNEITHFKGDGIFEFIQPPSREDLIIQGGYNGIYLMAKDKNRWKEPVKIANFDLVARELLFDEKGYLWVGHGYNGVYRLRLNESYTEVIENTLFDDRKGLPSKLFTNLFKEGNSVLFGTIDGVYEYNSNLELIQPHPKFQELIGAGLTRRLTQVEGSRDIFYLKGYDNEDEAGIISYSNNGTLEIKQKPFQKLRGQLIPAFEEIQFTPEGNIIFGSKDGIIIYNEHQPANTKFNALINEVKLSESEDSILFGSMYTFNENMSTDHVIRLPYAFNALKIDYSATYFEDQDFLHFQTKLDGFDNGWSQWSDSRTKEYTNLPEGTYTFHVRVRNIFNEIGEEDQFSFVIDPPWYRTRWIYGAYSTLLFLAVYLMINFKNKQIARLKRSQQLLIDQKEAKHTLEKLESERKLHQIESEKMLSEIDNKSKELDISTMHLMRTNQTILDLKEKIEFIKEKAKTGNVYDRLKNFMEKIDDIIENQENWKNFELMFNQIHHNFLHELKLAYPSLSSRDIRLCAYLRMDLSSKEIAPLMGVSFRAVEALRYRVRKKMGLSGNESLTDFILQLKLIEGDHSDATN